MMKKSKFLLGFILIPLMLIVASCQTFATNSNDDQNSKPPWLTPATLTSSPNATRTPLVIPERTSIPFREVIQSPGNPDLPHYTSRHPAIVILTDESDIAKVQEMIDKYTIPEIEKVNFDENIVIVIFHGYITSYDIWPAVKMVYLQDDHVQIHTAFRQFEFEDGESFRISSPLVVIRIKKENLPDRVTFDLVVKSEVLQSVDAVIPGN